jgi:putative transcriptional regulator
MFSFNPLWKLLVDKGMTKTQLREALDFSPATLARMGKGEHVAMELVDKICGHFNVQPNDIMEHKGE